MNLRFVTRSLRQFSTLSNSIKLAFNFFFFSALRLRRYSQLAKTPPMVSDQTQRKHGNTHGRQRSFARFFPRSTGATRRRRNTARHLPVVFTFPSSSRCRFPAKKLPSTVQGHPNRKRGYSLDCYGAAAAEGEELFL